MFQYFNIVQNQCLQFIIKDGKCNALDITHFFFIKLKVCDEDEKKKTGVQLVGIFVDWVAVPFKILFFE